MKYQKVISIVLLAVVLISVLVMVVQPAEAKAKKPAPCFWKSYCVGAVCEYIKVCEIPVTYCNHPGPACVRR